MEPMINDDVREMPMWKCWLHHRKLLLFVTRTSFEIHEVETARTLVDDYLEAFSMVCALLVTDTCLTHRAHYTLMCY